MPIAVRRTLRFARSCLNRIVGPRAMARLAASGDAPIVVFFYHRIADTATNPWTMSTAQFERQIQTICKRCEVIGLDEVQRRVRLRQSFTRAAAITFDDGYADNSRFAIPLLVKHRLPCTYFVSLENVKHSTPFPHDVAAGCPLAPNTIEDLRHWAKAGLEIGLHTRNHFDFSLADDAETIHREIETAKTELENLIEQPIRYFAFPYGMPQHLSCAAIDAIARCGMSGFCSAFGAYNIPGKDDFHIRRVHADVESERFSNWLNFDQGKLKLEPVVNYERPAVGEKLRQEESSPC